MGSPYAVTYIYSDDEGLRERAFPAHLDYLLGLVEDGRLLVAGPTPGEQPGGLMVYRCADEAEAQLIVESDPFIAEGVVASVDIRQWTPAIGPLTAAFEEPAQAA